jgi:peptide/nickel transport system substrate-binding protein
VEIKLKNQTIAIVLIIILAVGAVGAWYYLNPPAPAEKVVILMGTTDSVESSLDMAQAYDYFGWEIITALSSGLVEIEPGSQAGADDIVPALALSWDISTDGKTWDFTLRQGLTYDGVRPFNASCVKYTYDRNCNLTGVGLFDPAGPQVNMEYNAIIESVEVISDYVVRFNLKIAFTPFLQLLSCAASYIVDPMYAPMDTLTTYVEGDNHSTPCGLGPYLLKSWVRVGGSDSEVRLVKNPYYWNAAGGYPKNDEIIIKMYLNSNALATAMTAGEIDIAYRQLDSLQIQDFREDPNVRVWEGVGAQIQYLCFQQNIAPFNETGVRQAITAALNRTHVTNLVFLDDFTPLWSIIPAGMAYHKDSFSIWGSANYTYTVSKLAEFGYDAENKLVVDLWYESSGHYPSSEQQAQVYLSDLEASGVIDVVLHGTEWATFRTLRNAGSMPVFIYGWYPDFIDPDNYGFLPFASWLNLGYNSTYPAGGVAQYDLWVAGRSAATPAARQTAYYALQDLQATECSVVPLWQSNTVAVTGLNVHGVVLDITVNWRHWLLYLGAAATTGP